MEILHTDFSAEHGLYFKRNPDGSVTVKKMATAAPDEKELIFEQTIPDGLWCSIVCCVSKGGEINNRFYKAADFHNK